MNDRFIHNNSELYKRRKTLRNNATPQERILWFHLCNSKLGYKFQRQHSIGPYIVDFYCAQKKIVVEIDGIQHQENKIYDDERTRFLELQGCKVLRFWNNEINNNFLQVLDKIHSFLI